MKRAWMAIIAVWTVGAASAGASAPSGLPHARVQSSAVRATYAQFLDRLLLTEGGRELMHEMAARHQVFGIQHARGEVATVLEAIERLRPHAAGESDQAGLREILERKLGLTAESSLEPDAARTQREARNFAQIRKPELPLLRSFAIKVEPQYINDLSLAGGKILSDDTRYETDKKPTFGINVKTVPSHPNRYVLTDFATGSGTPIDFTPPGSRLKFWRKRPRFFQGRLSVDGRTAYAYAVDPPAIHRVDLTTGRTLTPIAIPGPFDHFRISADGRQALTMSRETREQPVWITELATGTSREIGLGQDAFFSRDLRSVFVHGTPDKAEISVWDIGTSQKAFAFTLSRGDGIYGRAPEVGDRSSERTFGDAYHFYTKVESMRDGPWIHDYAGGTPSRIPFPESTNDDARLTPDGRFALYHVKGEPILRILDCERDQTYRIQPPGISAALGIEALTDDRLLLRSGDEGFVYDFDALLRSLKDEE
jgi:hypothetical protein